MKEIFKNKKIVIGLSAALFVLLCVIFALVFHHVRNGWKEKDGVMSYKIDGKKVTGLNVIEGVSYYFDQDGKLPEGWFSKDGFSYYQDRDGLYMGERTVNGTPCCFQADGIFLSGFYELDGKKYYRNDRGYPYYGELELAEGEWYYISEDSSIFTGWYTKSTDGPYYDPSTGLMIRNKLMKINADTFFFDEKGKTRKGWYENEEGTRYFDENGVMQTGFITVDGVDYYLNKNGLIDGGLAEIDGKTYYVNADGSLGNGWIECEDGFRYFDENGEMKTGLFTDEDAVYFLSENGLRYSGFKTLDDGYYYFDADGKRFTGWIETADGYWYFDADGKRVDGWQDIDGAKYYFENNIMTSGWKEIEKSIYLFAEDGKMQTGWQNRDGKKVYLKEDGSMAMSETTISGVKYNFESDGSYKEGWIEGKYYSRGYLLTGWQKIGNKYWFLNSDGTAFSGGWLDAGGARRHFENDGTASTGWKSLGGAKYYFSEVGIAFTGYNKIGSSWYYFNSDGTMFTNGWVNLSGVPAYFGSDGSALSGWQSINGESYYLQNGGKISTGFVSIGSYLYVFNSAGHPISGPAWYQSGGKKYYIQADSTLLTGLKDVDGSTYYFASDGAMKTGWQKINGNMYFFESDGHMVRSTTIDEYIINENGVAINRFETITPENLDAYIEFLLDKNGRSLEAIYNYVRGNYKYQYKEKDSLVNMACRMLNTGKGACWDYAAVTYLMLKAAGYNCQIVIGKGYYATEHNWVIIEVEPGVWRHMDTERMSLKVFLVTDAQLDAWNMKWAGVRYDWPKEKYPAAV